jgi:flavin reductase (DIM6/NTAB) family NADH-FMN oxidoreductase RutF
LDEKTFREAMGKFATGITVVTTELDGEIHGMTANAFISVSLNPPLVLVSVDQKAGMHEKLKKAGRFTVSILNQDQQALSMHFSRQRLLESVVPFYEKLGGQSVIKDALAAVSCRLYDAHPSGDHTLYIGEVEELKVGSGKPLTYFEGKYNDIEK